MSFFLKRDNLLITGGVVVFFVILGLWHDIGGIRSHLLSSTHSSSTSDIIFVDGNNTPHTLSEFRGKPLLVNFWATWCPVCVRKMDSLNRIAEKIEAAGGVVLNISNDQTGIGTVRSFYLQKGYKNLPIYLDPRGSLIHAFGGRGLPTAVLINADGDVVAQIEGGFDWTTDRAYNLIKSKLGLNIS